MIWYVDIEHEKIVKDPDRSLDQLRGRNRRAALLADIAGVTCQPIHYLEVNRALAQEKGIGAIVISGNCSDWEEYDFTTFHPLCELVKAGEIPVIGLCGGHQLLAFMYGGKCDAIRKLRRGEEDPGGFAPGYFKELGYRPVHVVAEDALFDGMGLEPVFHESHYWEVKELPAELELLASTDECRVQAMRNTQAVIYGTQFHPEVHTDAYPDGRRLLTNFFRIAGILAA